MANKDKHNSLINKVKEKIKKWQQYKRFQTTRHMLEFNKLAATQYNTKKNKEEINKKLTELTGLYSLLGYKETLEKIRSGELIFKNDNEAQPSDLDHLTTKIRNKYLDQITELFPEYSYNEALKSPSYSYELALEIIKDPKFNKNVKNKYNNLVKEDAEKAKNYLLTLPLTYDYAFHLLHTKRLLNQSETIITEKIQEIEKQLDAISKSNNKISDKVLKGKEKAKESKTTQSQTFINQYDLENAKKPIEQILPDKPQEELLLNHNERQTVRRRIEALYKYKTTLDEIESIKNGQFDLTTKIGISSAEAIIASHIRLLKALYPTESRNSQFNFSFNTKNLNAISEAISSEIEYIESRYLFSSNPIIDIREKESIKALYYNPYESYGNYQNKINNLEKLKEIQEKLKEKYNVQENKFSYDKETLDLLRIFEKAISYAFPERYESYRKKQGAIPEDKAEELFYAELIKNPYINAKIIKIETDRIEQKNKDLNEQINQENIEIKKIKEQFRNDRNQIKAPDNGISSREMEVNSILNDLGISSEEESLSNEVNTPHLPETSDSLEQAIKVEGDMVPPVEESPATLEEQQPILLSGDEAETIKKRLSDLYILKSQREILYYNTSGSVDLTIKENLEKIERLKRAYKVKESQIFDVDSYEFNKEAIQRFIAGPTMIKYQKQFKEILEIEDENARKEKIKEFIHQPEAIDFIEFWRGKFVDSKIDSEIERLESTYIFSEDIDEDKELKEKLKTKANIPKISHSEIYKTTAELLEIKNKLADSFIFKKSYNEVNEEDIDIFKRAVALIFPEEYSKYLAAIKNPPKNATAESLLFDLLIQPDFILKKMILVKEQEESIREYQVKKEQEREQNSDYEKTDKGFDEHDQGIIAKPHEISDKEQNDSPETDQEEGYLKALKLKLDIDITKNQDSEEYKTKLSELYETLISLGEIDQDKGISIESLRELLNNEETNKEIEDIIHENIAEQLKENSQEKQPIAIDSNRTIVNENSPKSVPEVDSSTKTYQEPQQEVEISGDTTKDKIYGDNLKSPRTDGGIYDNPAIQAFFENGGFKGKEHNRINDLIFEQEVKRLAAERLEKEKKTYNPPARANNVQKKEQENQSEQREESIIKITDKADSARYQRIAINGETNKIKGFLRNNSNEGTLNDALSIEFVPNGNKTKKYLILNGEIFKAVKLPLNKDGNMEIPLDKVTLDAKYNLTIEVDTAEGEKRKFKIYPSGLTEVKNRSTQTTLVSFKDQTLDIVLPKNLFELRLKKEVSLNTIPYSVYAALKDNSASADYIKATFEDKDHKILSYYATESRKTKSVPLDKIEMLMLGDEAFIASGENLTRIHNATVSTIGDDRFITIFTKPGNKDGMILQVSETVATQFSSLTGKITKENTNFTSMVKDEKGEYNFADTAITSKKIELVKTGNTKAFDLADNQATENFYSDNYNSFVPIQPEQPSPNPEEEDTPTVTIPTSGYEKYFDTDGNPIDFDDNGGLPGNIDPNYPTPYDQQHNFNPYGDQEAQEELEANPEGQEQPDEQVAQQEPPPPPSQRYSNLDILNAGNEAAKLRNQNYVYNSHYESSNYAGAFQALGIAACAGCIFGGLAPLGFAIFALTFVVSKFVDFTKLPWMFSKTPDWYKYNHQLKECNKYSELQRLKEQLAVASLDPNRSKEADKLRAKIAKTEKKLDKLKKSHYHTKGYMTEQIDETNALGNRMVKDKQGVLLPLTDKQYQEMRDFENRLLDKKAELKAALDMTVKQHDKYKIMQQLNKVQENLNLLYQDEAYLDRRTPELVQERRAINERLNDEIDLEFTEDENTIVESYTRQEVAEESISDHLEDSAKIQLDRLNTSDMSNEQIVNNLRNNIETTALKINTKISPTLDVLSDDPTIYSSIKPIYDIIDKSVGSFYEKVEKVNENLDEHNLTDKKKNDIEKLTYDQRTIAREAKILQNATDEIILSTRSEEQLETKRNLIVGMLNNDYSRSTADNKKKENKERIKRSLEEQKTNLDKKEEMYKTFKEAYEAIYTQNDGATTYNKEIAEQALIELQESEEFKDDPEYKVRLSKLKTTVELADDNIKEAEAIVNTAKNDLDEKLDKVNQEKEIVEALTNEAEEFYTEEQKEEDFKKSQEIINKYYEQVNKDKKDKIKHKTSAEVKAEAARTNQGQQNP